MYKQPPSDISRDIGDYKIYNEIGKGSFGTVYKGINKTTKQEVALKFIIKNQKRPRDLKNLKQQNQLLRKINHPNVISLKDVIETSKQIIIVTDYAGCDLSHVIEQKKKFSLDKVKQLSVQILNAMLYLNQNRIIHRDLKPQNILIKNNHIKLCDFGFAKKLSASTNFLQSMKGTPLYLAPQIVRQTKYTQKVDVWSFGCIIYELFTGRTPYYANTFEKLAPLILYQQVQYPKDMPAQLKQLICSMLQKNPSARPNWKQLKDHSFFQINDPLKQKNQNGIKQYNTVQTDNYLALHKQDSDFNNNNKNQKIMQSKVIQRLDNKNDIEAYFNDFKKIFQDLNSNLLSGNDLKKDILFLHKIKQIFHQRSQSNPHISDELLDLILNILNFLIKIKKSNQNEKDHMTNQEDDITKNQTLIIAILCLAKIQKNHEMLQKQLRIICLLIKRNFNGVSINTQIDQEITQFVAQILLQKNDELPIQCIRNGLIIIGTLANQALTTFNTSFAYFERVAEDRLLSKIAKIYKKQSKYSIVLQCLKQFIHPVRDLPLLQNKNHESVISAKMYSIFRSFKEQVAEALLKTNFISQISQLSIYNESNTNLIVDYCDILLQCMTVSSQIRKQFLRHNYWIGFLQNRKTKPYLFGYNSILIQKQNINIIPKQSIVTLTKQSQQNKLLNLFIIEIGYDNLKKKNSKAGNNISKNKLMYEKSMLEMLSDMLFLEQSIKQKSVKEIYGVLESTSKCFDQPIINIYTSIVQSQIKSENSQDNNQLIQNIFKKICNINNPFKLNSYSFYKLMKIFTQSDIIKQIKSQKSLHLYFYDNLDNFIRNQQLQHIQNYFEQSFIPQFIGKLIQCINWLTQIEQNQGKAGNFSQNALSLSKIFQTASFYRFMFIDSLNQNQMYEHLKYTNKILTVKNSQVEPQFTNFLGVRVVPLCQKFVNSNHNNENLLIEIFIFISQLVRDYSQFNNQVIGTKIIKRFKQWLTESKYSDSLRQKVLYLIGNLAKRSQFFFNQFAMCGVIYAIVICLQNNSSHMRIYKNAIYSIGNISYYSQKFYKQIIPMIPLLTKTFQMNDQHLKNNLISTISNLVRFSNVYLQTLIKTGIIKHILKLASESKQADQTLSLSLSVIKKIICYNEFFDVFGYRDLQIIYQKTSSICGESNEGVRKIKDVLKKAGRKV